MSDQSYFAHPSACIDRPCTIGAGSKIRHFCHIMAGAHERCNPGQNVFVAGDVVIGSNVKIQNHVSVYTGVTLEDDVFCGPSCVFTTLPDTLSSIFAAFGEIVAQGGRPLVLPLHPGVALIDPVGYLSLPVFGDGLAHRRSVGGGPWHPLQARKLGQRQPANPVSGRAGSV